MDKKRCTKCGQIKPISEFGKQTKNKDGLRYSCKACDRLYDQSPEVKEKAAAYRNSEKGKAWRKQYEQSEHGREVIARAKARYFASEKGYKATRRYRRSMKARATKEAYRNKSRYKIRARAYVNNQARDGKIPHISTLQCRECGEQAHEYHHYNGYARKNWLDIIPLCERCHRLLHTEE